MADAPLAITPRTTGDGWPLTPAGPRPASRPPAGVVPDDAPPAPAAAESRSEGPGDSDQAGLPLAYGANGRLSAGPPVPRGQLLDLRG